MEKKKHSHKGHRQRLKNKALEGGIEHWPHHEVLELILTYTIPYKDVNPLAHTLIEKFGTLSNVLNAGYEHLKKIDGVGHETALFLSLLPDIFDRYNASKNTESILLDTPGRCVNYFRTTNHIKNYEEFIVFCLDNKKRLIKTIRMNKGTASSVSFSLKEFTNQISFPSNRHIVVMHSHPGGDSNPTASDIIATKRLLTACFSVGVNMLDHIIVAESEFYSFLKDNLFNKMVNEISEGMNTLLKFNGDEEPK